MAKQPNTATAVAPAPTLNFDVDLSNPALVAPIAAAAWDTVKGKDDATFATATGDFRGVLLAHAKSALTSNAILKGDTNLARFEQEVNRLRLAANK